MKNESVFDLKLFGSLIIGAIFVLIFKLLWKTSDEKGKDDQEETPDTTTSKVTEIKTKKKITVKYNKRTKPPAFTHEMLCTTLKGHTESVKCIDFSLNGKYLLSCSEDQSIRLWSVKDFGSGNKCARVNIEFDHANLVRFSPDNRAFIAGMHSKGSIQVYKLGKKDDGVTTTCVPIEVNFPKYKNSTLLNIGVGTSSSGGSFVMSAYQDTTVIVHDLKGNVLHQINTNLSNNNWAQVSPCGRYIGVCGWTPDVKIYAVTFNRNGTYKQVQDAFILQGHTTTVCSFAFNLDSTKMLTVSKDSTWRLFDTDIEWEKRQDSYLLHQGKLTLRTSDKLLCALSSDGNCGVVCDSDSIQVFSTTTGEVELKANGLHQEVISSVAFDISGKYVLTTGDKFIRVFNNALNYKEKIKSLQASLKNAKNQALKERLTKQLLDCENSFRKIVSA